MKRWRRRTDAAIDEALAVAGWRKPGLPPSFPPAPPPPKARTALTPWERSLLATLATTDIPDQGAHNGREIADAARQLLPDLSDTQIGRAILQAYWSASMFHRAMPPGLAMTATLDALGAAALDLTTLDRTDVPR